MYVYTIIYYTNYTPIVQILLEKKNYTRLHPLTLWLPRSWVPLVASSTISWWRRWVWNIWGCRPHKNGFDARKNIQKNLSQLSQTSFCRRFCSFVGDLSPLRPSPLCESSVGIRKHQCHGSPKTIHSFPPIRDMEKPNTSAWHIFWYMFIYIYIIYVISYYIYTCNVSHMFFKQIWMNLTYDTFCEIFILTYIRTYPNIFSDTFSNICSGGEDECLTQNLES